MWPLGLLFTIILDILKFLNLKLILVNAVKPHYLEPDGAKKKVRDICEFEISRVKILRKHVVGTSKSVRNNHGIPDINVRDIENQLYYFQQLKV